NGHERLCVLNLAEVVMHVGAFDECGWRTALIEYDSSSDARRPEFPEFLLENPRRRMRPRIALPAMTEMTLAERAGFLRAELHFERIRRSSSRSVRLPGIAEPELEGRSRTDHLRRDFELDRRGSRVVEMHARRAARRPLHEHRSALERYVRARGP